MQALTCWRINNAFTLHDEQSVQFCLISLIHLHVGKGQNFSIRQPFDLTHRIVPFNPSFENEQNYSLRASVSILSVPHRYRHACIGYARFSRCSHFALARSAENVYLGNSIMALVWYCVVQNNCSAEQWNGVRLEAGG